MTDLPLRDVHIADFRKLSGRRTLPLDAPVVLLHGPNGTGKTSVLSALELALTGAVRSMRRSDSRYTAHLPTYGQDFATVRATVTASLSSGVPGLMTVGGSRIEGAPALTQEAAQFYSERCYLDQASLGRLLEIYQHQDGREEAPLVRFVNELLGLEQLDYLRTGLADAGHLARLRKLSLALVETEAERTRADEAYRAAIETEQGVSASRVQAQRDLRVAALAAGVDLGDVPDDALGQITEERLASYHDSRISELQRLNESLVALGGRVEALRARPAMSLLQEARQALELATAAEAQDHTTDETIIQWYTEAAQLGVAEIDDPELAISGALHRIDERLRYNRGLIADVLRLEPALEDCRARLALLQGELTNSQAQAGALAEGLATLRDGTTDNICPVCDRDFSEVSPLHLSAHIEQKLNQLTREGQRLQELKASRDMATAEMHNVGRALTNARELQPSAEAMEQLQVRESGLLDLQRRFETLKPAIRSRKEASLAVRQAKATVAEFEFMERETEAVRLELTEAATLLKVEAQELPEPLSEATQHLTAIARAQLQIAREKERALASARDTHRRLRDAQKEAEGVRISRTQAADRKQALDVRVEEAMRRKNVANEVLKAAANARANIVQRVFNNSLNSVWRSVFTRLAPREPFVPAFGLPSATKSALHLEIETVHSSGDTSGSPQVMLSAGNLNTAALSLFIALHLAVEPVLPCLVFDDPVQSMDEVHISQFAGLMRVLSKHHKRQVIIAVHERELFEYLSLELSPAYEGDELITIELGGRTEEADGGVTRHTWSPDPAFAEIPLRSEG